MQKYNRESMIAGLDERSVAYNEFFRVEAMSAGLYRLNKGAQDPQTPHSEDEVYYILSGSGSIEVAGEITSVRPGDFVYVRAGDDHRFLDITEALEVLVIFAPAEKAK